MIISEEEHEDFIAHYGILRKSGRYPWGSGNNVATRSRDFLGIVEDLRSQGFTDLEIAKGFHVYTPDGEPMSSTDFRHLNTIAKNQIKMADQVTAQRLKKKGMSNGAIAAKMGLSGESMVRALLAPHELDKAQVLTNIANTLKDGVREKKFVQVGTGVELHPPLGVSRNRLDVALTMLKEQGYVVETVPVRQLGTGKDTNVKVLAAPGTTWGDIARNKYNIQLLGEWFQDYGRTKLGLHPPISIDSSRLAIRYKEDGGDALDGVIYVREGVKDISLDKSRYAQVRVLIDGTHYAKGMAIYSTDIPDGVDLVFHTVKSDTGNKLDALKPVKKDPVNPDSPDPDNLFGSSLKRQIVDIVDGVEVLRSAMNIVNEEGGWKDWSRSLSSQFLGKQSPVLAKKQLAMKVEEKQQEFEEIMALTNPTVKKKLLQSFADGVDSDATDLSAASLTPDSRHHVILPVPSMSDHEVYAPNYENGTRVVLIRHPHAGPFELPELTVNNKHPQAKALLEGSRDAIGISQATAQRMSGADFDGDTVIVVPNMKGEIKTAPALAGLADFDPVGAYPKYEGMPVLTEDGKQHEMGHISNLITDMTIKGASPEELARAVRHSMVVIDAEKHELNYRQSAIDNGIRQLRERYQTGPRGGAATLLSRAGSKPRIPDRNPRRASDGGPIDPVTGEKVYTPTNKVYKNADGTTTLKTIKVKQLGEVSDAFELSSGTRVETVYAEHANKMKAIANAARLESLKQPPIHKSESAPKVYATEVAALKAGLELQVFNRPLERQAQVMAGAIAKAKRADNPNMDDDARKKVEFQALREARLRTGAAAHAIIITPRQWEAIQHGAISNSMLEELLNKADLDVVKRLATPRTTKRVMTPSKLARAQQMFASGYTRAEVARALGVALGTLDEAIYPAEGG